MRRSTGTPGARQAVKKRETPGGAGLPRQTTCQEGARTAISSVATGPFALEENEGIIAYARRKFNETMGVLRLALQVLLHDIFSGEWNVRRMLPPS
jgi:hypothetical protein